MHGKTEEKKSWIFILIDVNCYFIKLRKTIIVTYVNETGSVTWLEEDLGCGNVFFNFILFLKTYAYFVIMCLIKKKKKW